MSEEFDVIPDNRFSSFVPLTIALLGFLVWFGFQDYSLNNQRIAYEQQISSAMPTYNEAVGIAGKYKGVLKELVETAQKDPAAAQIVKEAVQAGWISFQQGSNSAANPAEPAPSK
jgi:hypothetical protein